MYKKIATVSVLSICVVCSAGAATFPTDGLMKSSATYTEAATYENLGTYDGEVTAEAEYEDILYNIASGYYLPHSQTTRAQCLEGSFCTGLTNVLYDEVNDQGITACSTLGDGSYVNSAAGAKAETDCYKACTLANINSEYIAHASGVSGNDYYGERADTCQINACENGYHVLSGGTLSSIIGDEGGNGLNYRKPDGSTGESGSGYTSLTTNGTFAVSFPTKGKLKGAAACSTTGGNGLWSEGASSSSGVSRQPSASLSDLTGQEGAVYCWCRLTDYLPAEANATWHGFDGYWTYRVSYTDAAACSNSCVGDCARYINYNTDSFLLMYRTAFLTGSSLPARCDANTISITWGDTTDSAVTSRNAGQCTYGGDIRTPSSAISKPGKRFLGWRFRKTGQGN